MWSNVKNSLDVKISQAKLARPYPQELEESCVWQGQSVILRPIKPTDIQEHMRFFLALDPVDVRMRIFHSQRELQSAQLVRLTQIDYDREMAFVAVRKRINGTDETLGVVRGIADAENINAEFAVIIRSDLKGQGLGYVLMNKLITYFRQRGTAYMVGEMLSENTAMHDLAIHLGFTVHAEYADGTMTLKLKL